MLHWPHFMAQELPQMAVMGLLQRVWSKTRPGNCLHSASLGFAATAQTAKKSEKKHCCSPRGMRVPKGWNAFWLICNPGKENVSTLPGVDEESLKKGTWNSYFQKLCWGFCCFFLQEEIIRRLNLDTILPLAAASATTMAPSWWYNSRRPTAKMH